MKITKDIKKAVKKAVDSYGNVYQLSKKLGIAHSTILFWLDGKTSNISGDLWYEKLEPVLRPFLEYQDKPDCNPPGKISETPAQYKSEVSSPQKLHEVPILNFAQAAGYDPTFEPIDDYAVSCSSETALFDLEVRQGYFALRVDGDSMSPLLPDGAIIYVAGGDYAEDGDLVVAKIRESGQVVVKKLSRKSDMICLNSINPEGQNFEWRKNENPLVWMWPIIEYTVMARKQRWEKHKYNGSHHSAYTVLQSKG